MAHFAKIENNIVTNVIVAEQEFGGSGGEASTSEDYPLTLLYIDIR